MYLWYKIKNGITLLSPIQLDGFANMVKESTLKRSFEKANEKVISLLEEQRAFLSKNGVEISADDTGPAWECKG